jgi:hypothetical protein
MRRHWLVEGAQSLKLGRLYGNVRERTIGGERMLWAGGAVLKSDGERSPYVYWRTTKEYGRGDRLLSAGPAVRRAKRWIEK